MSDNATAVKEFTEGYTGIECPAKPVVMNRENVLFLIRMVISELDELACTVSATKEECDQLLQTALETRDRCHNFDSDYATEVTKVAAQADALVDAWYYSLNLSAKHGINLSKLFDIIHEANMKKRDPTTGKFIRRSSDGKVIKPAGWQPPDIDAEIQRQMTHGSWN